jgi:hypothetical protein
MRSKKTPETNRHQASNTMNSAGMLSASLWPGKSLFPAQHKAHVVKSRRCTNPETKPLIAKKCTTTIQSNNMRHH